MNLVEQRVVDFVAATASKEPTQVVGGHWH